MANQETTLNGTRCSGDEICLVLGKTFGLTPFAACQVWTAENIPNKGIPGKIPDEGRTDIRLLKSIKLIRHRIIYTIPGYY